MVKIQSSSDVSVFGASGNYHLFNTSEPIIAAAGSHNLSIMGMVRMPSAHEPRAGPHWLVDDGSSPPATAGGYAALLLHRDR